MICLKVLSLLAAKVVRIAALSSQNEILELMKKEMHLDLLYFYHQLVFEALLFALILLSYHYWHWQLHWFYIGKFLGKKTAEVEVQGGGGCLVDKINGDAPPACYLCGTRPPNVLVKYHVCLIKTTDVLQFPFNMWKHILYWFFLFFLLALFLCFYENHLCFSEGSEISSQIFWLNWKWQKHTPLSH